MTPTLAFRAGGETTDEVEDDRLWLERDGDGDLADPNPSRERSVFFVLAAVGGR
jgi:hypothetical protein